MSYLPEKPIRVSTLNSTTTPLTASEAFTGTWEDTTDSSMMSVAFGAGSPVCTGTLYLEFSQDGTTTDRAVTIPVSNLAAPSPGIHTLIPISSYFRVRYVNGTTVQTQFRLQTLFHRFLSKGPTSRLFQSASAYTDVDNVRAFISAIDRPNDQTATPRMLTASPEGSLRVEISDPLAPFGNLAVAEPSAQVHLMFPFNQQPTSIGRYHLTASGNVTVGDGLLTLSTGTGSLAAATFTSRRVIQYYPGQGSGAKFTAMFSSGSANSQLYAGVGHTEEGFFFAQIDDTFGIVHRRNGRRPIYAFTVSTAATASANATITLNSASVSVPVTNNTGAPARTAQEIAAVDYSRVGVGWDAFASGSIVYFTGLRSVPTTGLFQGSGVGMSGSFTQYVAGVTAASTFVSQSAWNLDTLDGHADSTNPSGLTLDRSFLNVYSIDYQYLGAGAITFKVEEPGSGSFSRGRFLTVHKIKYAGSSRTPSLQRTSLPLQFAAVSLGSTTDVSISTASASGYTWGKIIHLGPQRAFTATKTSIGTSFTPVLTFMNPRSRIDETTRSNSRVSFVEAIIEGMTFANVGTKGAEVRLYRSVTLNNTAAFTALQDSVLLYDTSATSFTGGVLVWATSVAAGTNVTQEFSAQFDKLILNANDMYTVVVASTATTTDMTVSVTWTEQGI